MSAATLSSVIWKNWGPFMVFSRLHKLVFSNRVIGLICISVFLFLLIYIYKAEWSEHVARDKISVGLFPKWTLFLAIFFSVGMIFNKYREDVPVLLQDFNYKTLIISLLGLFFCWLYFFVLTYLGFIVTTFFFTALATFFLGPKSWKTSLVLALIITFFTYGFFYLLQVELPVGDLMG